MLARLLLAVVALAGSTQLTATAAPADNVRSHLSWEIGAPSLGRHCSQEIAIAKRRVDSLVASHAPRTAAMLVKLEDILADMNDRTAVDQFLFSVAPTRQVRDASQNCQDEQSAFFATFGARPDVYKALVSIKASNTAAAPYQTKLLELYLETAKRAGAGLGAKDRATFVELSKQLAKLQTMFAANLGNAKTTIAITSAQAAGLDPDLVARFTKNPDGTYSVPVDDSTIGPFLQDATDSAARRAFYVAYARRGAPQNVALLEQAIAIRYRLAHLLGFKSWAEYQLANKMAQRPGRVISFLDSLDSRLLAGARQNLATLAQLKAKDTSDPSARIEPWDFSFYDNQLRKSQYAIDRNEVKQYFPVQHTIDAVLGIYSKLLGVTFAQGADDGWLKAPMLLHYTVSDTATGRFIGDTYFDLYPRDGKAAGFFNAPVLPNRRRSDGTTRAPLSVIVGNWPLPAPGKPALLSHGEVQTFFHEFGHDMAALLATAPYETLSQGFRQDFVEAPSQMLENWVWDPAILHELSSRWDTGAPMPDDLVQRLIAARYVDQSYFYTRQAFYALVDMAYHTSAGPRVDTTSVWAQTMARTSPIPFVPGTYPQAGFGHLMGGYDAGYYGYLWSKVYAQDMFTRFQREGLESPVAGHAYRSDILAPASTYEPDQEIRAFLGRPMNPNAFYADLGLAPTALH